MDATYFALFSLLFSSFITADLLVTLQHGGQLRGKSFDYDGQTIGLFLGVRYAAAPTGSQRFRKPSPPKPWSGTIDAISASSVCVQKGFLNPDELIGDEDCLFMDITVPGGVDPTNKKPVMVWIHGGGYMFGSKDNYIGASLAKHGDVIVVTINYRVDVLGFLFNGPGTGNFGLWDQRAALVWIQDNIQRFGGDPDLVTIFGESAGGGSVSAQLLGQHNDGLFKRGIQQSGSLYTDWGWYTSERQWKEIVEGIKEKGNCQSSESVYDCLSGLSLEKIYALVSSNDMANNFWHPMPDNDFFSSDVMNEDYALSRRYFNKTTAEDKPLVDIVMTIWTNFAKSGNPSKPVSLPESVPEWPEFDRKSNQFMELGRNYKVVTTPQKERLELLTNTVMAARQMQVLADKGVRYAASPTGSRRFQKPSPPEPWTGTMDAVSRSNYCIQFKVIKRDSFVALIGDEDCLFMDITVPGGVDPTNKKPVMMFIHGGGYTSGSKDIFLGASLAKHGDVIVVTINYRLDALGFLYEGPGTGNFGLWDQRAALVWIQDNIQRFGGDPDLVTIFGESAGSGSVSAQLMGQHNDGLFKRGIQESGSLYDDWGWYTSERQWKEVVEGIKRKRNCPSSESVYNCLSGLSPKAICAVLPPNNLFNNVWHPMPDDDFFSPEVKNDGYNLSRRFDLLGGFNGQEGASFLVPTALNLTQESIAKGMSEKYADIGLEFTCSTINRLSVNLCKDFFIRTYGLDTAANDTERGIRYTYAMGELYFNGDLVRQLQVHSIGPKATYAYYFDQPLQNSFTFLTSSPFRVSASHGEELPFVFGFMDSLKVIWEEYFGPGLTEEAAVYFPFFNSTTAEDKPLSNAMMTMWTNFARTGNPNKPMSLPANVSEWPEFDNMSNKFMKLSKESRVVTTPNKERLERLINTVFKGRQAQVAEDTGTDCNDKKEIKRPADAVLG
ncbi:acetylcholinesterase-like [Watersipora subatra]|uniref:acetylcholinesterase-like n=1 Tax=Watersipora subatra TaxID=2589382 RepID=UPI00355C7158